MGNCPSEFVRSPVGLACIAQCPKDKGFDVALVNGAVTCQSKAEPTVYVTLEQLPTIQLQVGQSVPSYNDIPTKDIYIAEQKRVTEQFAIAYSKLDKDLKIKSAFQALQDAENVRDQSPNAYETARVNYYTLTKGDSWLQEERARVLASEAAPIVNQYVGAYNGNNQQMVQQQSTIDLVTSAKDKVLNVRDDMKYSVGQFTKHIADIRNQINMDKHVKSKIAEDQSNSWVELVLNILIILTTILAIVFVIRKLLARSPPTPTTTSIGLFRT
jgi:hypothetical protein